MSDTSANLAMPFIQPSQAQKHVTHNEAIAILDTLTQLSVLSSETTEPPASPLAGDRYIVAAGATLEWAGRDGEVATFDGTAWRFHVPAEGWRSWDQAAGRFLVHDGSGWTELGHDNLNNVDRLGIATTADAANPFAAKLNSALWTARPTAEGGTGNLMQSLNRESTANDLGMVLQTDYVTKAILGQFGSTDFRLSVSQDGTNFRDAFSVDEPTGMISQPNLPRFKAKTNFDNFAALQTWTKISINETDYNEQGAFDPATNLFTAPASGTYMLGASLMFKEDSTNVVRMSGRLVTNGTDVIPGAYGEISGPHAHLGTVIWLQTIANLSAGDTVELQGYVRGNAAYFAAEHSTFWGYKIG